MKDFSKYLSFIKFSHTIFAMPFALLGFFLGLDHTTLDFDYKIFILIILCMIFARNSAMAFNRLIDRKIDAKNPRTAVREIPSGKISIFNARLFVVINSTLFIISTFFINSLCFYLSPIALIVVLGYSYTKRFTSLCHYVLGIGLSLAPIGAYIAVTNSFGIEPILYSIIVFFWVSGFDIVYSLQDYMFDKQESLKSIPVLVGPKNALFISRFGHFLVIILVVLLSFCNNFSILNIIGSSIFILSLISQHLIIKHNDLRRVNLAFFTTNGIASVLYCGFLIADFVIK